MPSEYVVGVPHVSLTEFIVMLLVVLFCPESDGILFILAADPHPEIVIARTVKSSMKEMEAL